MTISTFLKISSFVSTLANLKRPSLCRIKTNVKCGYHIFNINVLIEEKSVLQ